MKIKVKAIGVNRADVFYRQGKYPVFGLEVAGISEDGRRIMGVVDGGAYAHEVQLEEGAWLEIPEHLSFTEAAAIIEALYTTYYNFVTLGNLKAGESVLIHGAASGIGVVGIQLAQLLGAKVTGTAGKAEKLKLIESLGARAVDYHNKDFGNEEFDLILDMVGADYFNENLKALKRGGRLAIIAFIGGAKCEAKLSPLLLKNLTVFGSTIRSLTTEQKIAVRDGIKPFAGKIKPVVDKVFAFSDKDAALDYVEAYKNIGKVVVAIE